MPLNAFLSLLLLGCGRCLSHRRSRHPRSPDFLINLIDSGVNCLAMLFTLPNVHKHNVLPFILSDILKYLFGVG